MAETEKKQSSFPGLVIGILVAVLLAGGATAWWAISSLRSFDPPSEPKARQEQPSEPEPSTAAEETSVQVYWLDTAPNADSFELRPSSVAVQKSAQPEAVLESAVQRLLEGPDVQEFATTIPKGTKLLGVDVESDGVHVNLSPEFTAGGGSASMMGRLGQLIYTATSLDPNAQVWIDVNGKPLDVLGGEGIVVEQPMTRENFDNNFPL